MAAGAGSWRPGLDAAPLRGDLQAAMSKHKPGRPPPAPLLEQLPAPVRRVAGITLLTVTLWLASVLALFR